MTVFIFLRLVVIIFQTPGHNILEVRLMKWIFPVLIIMFLTVAGLNLAASGLHRLLPEAPETAVGIITVGRENQLWIFGKELNVPFNIPSRPAYKRVLAD